MQHSRRQALTIFARAAGVLASTPLLASTLPASAQMHPQPIPSPNAPNQSFPPGLNGPDSKPGQDHQEVDPRKQQEIRIDIERLYDLAADLKQQAGKSDMNVTLPVIMVKKAQEIEKLARKIKDLSKG
jgi:hypothetical protein